MPWDDPLNLDRMKEDEGAKYTRAWSDMRYRQKAHGLEWWQRSRRVFGDVRSALDLGCGHGRLFAQWCKEGILGYGVDIADAPLDPWIAERHPDRFFKACLWDMDLPVRGDIGVAADVLEHLPPATVDPALDRMRAHCDRLFFKIANFRERTGRPPRTP